MITLDDTLHAGSSATGLVVSVGRLQSEAAEQVVQLGKALGNRGKMRSDLAKALADYMAKSGSFNAASFREFVLDSREHSGADQTMEALFQMWMAIEILGLNEDELEEIREYLYSEIVPQNLSTTQLHEAVMAAGKPMIAYSGN